MKHRITACMLAAASALFLLHTAPAVLAEEVPPLPEANTQTRHIDCTALSEQAQAYYSGDYSIDALMSLEGAPDSSSSLTAMQDNALFDALHALMADTQTYDTSYSGFNAGSLAYYWNSTDAAESYSDFISFYSDINYGYYTPEGKQYNMEREHIWPKSRASYYQSNGGSDLHHLRPSVSEINRSKGDYAFGNIEGAYPGDTAEVVYGDALYGWSNSNARLFECKDDVKGDVSRILLYVYCRWMQPNLYSDVARDALPAFDPDDTSNNGLAVIESLDTLLEWMENDPVDTWEMTRNDLTEQVQGNRNVFIDYPELAWRLFGRDVPEQLQSPTHSGCHHAFEQTEIIPSDCTNEGSVTSTCMYCGTSKTKPIGILPHSDEDGDELCDLCGTVLTYPVAFTKTEEICAGDHLLIASKVNMGAPLAEMKSEKITLEPVRMHEDGAIADLDMAVFYVQEAEDGFYLNAGGKYLAVSEKGDVYYADEPAETGIWQFTKASDDTFYLTNLHTLYTDRNTGETFPKMLDLFKNALGVYYVSEPDENYEFCIYSCGDHVCGDELQPDCTEDQSAECQCLLCGADFTLELPAKGHTPGAAVTENEKKDETGQVTEYDTVTYCTDCGAELTRIHNVTGSTQEPEPAEQIAPDETLLEWAAQDYEAQTGTEVTASTAVKQDGTLEITLTDAENTTVDTYLIDTATGQGTNAANEPVDLPLTGRNAFIRAAVLAAASLMLLLGIVCIMKSGIRRKNRSSQ